MGRARRTPKRKLPVIKRIRQSRPAKQVSVRPITRRSKPVFAKVTRLKAGARGRRPVRLARSGRIALVRKAKPLPRSEKTLRVASRGLGVRTRISSKRGEPRRVPKRIGQRPQQKPFSLIPFQEDVRVFRVASKRGLQRSRGTAGRKIAVRKGLRAVSNVPFGVPRLIASKRREIGESIFNTDVTVTLPRIGLKKRIKKQNATERSGSDFNVLNLFG